MLWWSVIIFYIIWTVTYESIACGFCRLAFLISRVFSIKTKKDVFLRIVVLAFVISLFIEVNQLLFQVGTFQISDLVYNTLSGLIGYILYRILYKE